MASDSNDEKLPGRKVVDESKYSLLVHDIRHCLHVMSIGREMLARMYDDEKAREVCETMELEEEKITLLLDDLLEAYRNQMKEVQQA